MEQKEAVESFFIPVTCVEGFTPFDTAVAQKDCKHT